ncbi:uncharacterized protein LOC114459844 [Gouania willdenowi]|uniref:uncharacterized protein LOC114459844 n=1 Tax=Gouania willdenowi TaxID=441366 RepID=UPI001054B8DB|nr:uncharacterized protein LOC114459844 [Gouania willdenowi]
MSSGHICSSQGSDEVIVQTDEQRAEYSIIAQKNNEDSSKAKQQQAEPSMTAQEHDEDASQPCKHRAETLTISQLVTLLLESDEDARKTNELRVETSTISHDSDEDDSQTEEQRAETFNEAQSSQSNDDAGSQTEVQRADLSTLEQENVPQDMDVVHSHGLTEGQSFISILSFALKHNTTGVLTEDLLTLLKLHSAGTSAVPTSKYFLEKPSAGIVDTFQRHHYCRQKTVYTEDISLSVFR